jgi:hypothetical protein
MYDHDLRIWYRDLFLLSARRRVAAADQAGTARPWNGHAVTTEMALDGHELQRLPSHERPQTTN